MCLWTFALWHPWHASTHSLMSRFIRGQQYLSVMSFCVARLPGWHRPCCSSKIRLVAALGMMGRTLFWLTSHQSSVLPNFFFFGQGVRGVVQLPLDVPDLGDELGDV